MDFSGKMLEEARGKLREAVLVCADLLDEWPHELLRPYDRVVSSYALHHFDLDTKAALISHVTSAHLRPGGFVVIGDIAFPSAESRSHARRVCGPRWEDEEYYWAADETAAAFEPRGLRTSYTQVSSCGGVFVIKPVQQAGAADC
jgi:putative AdoMet-dependent methyltransferase